MEADRGPTVRHAAATGPGRPAEKARENRGDPEDPDPEDRETRVTLSLREIGRASTELAFHQGDFGSERRRALHEQGWTQSLNHLEELLGAPAAP